MQPAQNKAVYTNTGSAAHPVYLLSYERIICQRHSVLAVSSVQHHLKPKVCSKKLQQEPTNRMEEN